jgi:hypothetical protein
MENDNLKVVERLRESHFIDFYVRFDNRRNKMVLNVVIENTPLDMMYRRS